MGSEETQLPLNPMCFKGFGRKRELIVARQVKNYFKREKSACFRREVKKPKVETEYAETEVGLS